MHKDLNKMTEDELAELVSWAEQETASQIQAARQNNADVVSDANYRLAQKTRNVYKNLSNIYTKVRLERERRSGGCPARRFNGWETPDA